MKSVFSDRQIIMNALDPSKGKSNLTSALMYFNSITEYMTQLRSCLGELRDDIEYFIDYPSKYQNNILNLP